MYHAHGGVKVPHRNDTMMIMVIIMMVKGSWNDSTNGAYNQPRFLITSIYIYDLHVIESHLNPLRACMREHSPERIDRDSDGGFGSELCQSLPDYRRFFPSIGSSSRIDGQRRIRTQAPRCRSTRPMG